MSLLPVSSLLRDRDAWHPLPMNLSRLLTIAAMPGDKKNPPEIAAVIRRIQGDFFMLWGFCGDFDGSGAGNPHEYCVISQKASNPLLRRVIFILFRPLPLRARKTACFLALLLVCSSVRLRPVSVDSMQIIAPCGDFMGIMRRQKTAAGTSRHRLR